MAGHSKWANIKHRKGRADALRGKIFSRVSKEIISSVKMGGPDPKANTRLRLALTKARAANFPNDNIERLIKKASSADQADYVEITYELYGHGGVGIIAEIMTDNRTVFPPIYASQQINAAEILLHPALLHLTLRIKAS